MWRAGANVSTRLVTAVALDLAGTVIPPGEYTVFIELARDEWTLIISTFRATVPGEPQDGDPALFDAFDYTPDRDLVRVRMQLDTLPHRHDQLHWEFLDITQDGGTLAIIWDNQMASVPFTVGQ